MEYPTGTRKTHTLIEQLTKQLEINENEIASIKSLMVAQSMKLNEILKILNKVDQTVEHDVAHR